MAAETVATPPKRQSRQPPNQVQDEAVEGRLAEVLPTAGPRKLTQLRAGVPSRRSRLAGSAERTPRRSRKAAATRASPAGQLISFGQPDAARKLRCVCSSNQYILIHCIESRLTLDGFCRTVIRNGPERNGTVRLTERYSQKTNGTVKERNGFGGKTTGTGAKERLLTGLNG